MKKQLILAGLILAGAALTFSGCGNSKNSQSTAPAEKTSIIVGATACLLYTSPSPRDS